MTPTTVISEKARAILALDNELRDLEQTIFDLEAKLIVAQQKRQAAKDAILKIWNGEGER